MNQPTFFSDPLSAEDQKVVDEFVAKSKLDAYVGYSPLQCAADDEHEQAVKLLLKSATRESLEFVNSSNIHAKGTNENILDVAMKNPKIFKDCLDAVIKHPGLLTKLLNSKDVDGDNVLHQFIEFGRVAALKVLTESTSQEIQHALEIAMTQRNSEGYTPLELAKNFDSSSTIKRLLSEDILDQAKFEGAQKNLPQITSSLEEIQNKLHSSVGIKK